MPQTVSTEPDPGGGPKADSAQLAAAQRAFAAIDRGKTLHGLVVLESSPQLSAIPTVNSYRAYCIAKERGQCREAVRLCQSALDVEPHNPAHYLNLGRVFVQAGDKANAIATFWKGISRAPGAEPGVEIQSPDRDHAREHVLILEELRRLGIRKRAPFSSLRRGHPLNRIAGKLLSTVGLR
jgi:tetratricopeptide (TPR) repeat protein